MWRIVKHPPPLPVVGHAASPEDVGREKKVVVAVVLSSAGQCQWQLCLGRSCIGVREAAVRKEIGSSEGHGGADITSFLKIHLTYVVVDLCGPALKGRT